MFVSNTPKARGRPRETVGSDAAGTQNRRGRFASRPAAIKAGYFDELIPADYVSITGFKKRTRVNGLGVPLVGVRERTEARKAELSFPAAQSGRLRGAGMLRRI